MTVTPYGEDRNPAASAARPVAAHHPKDTPMELYFVYQDKRRNGYLSDKTFNLPETAYGALAVELDDGQLLKIVQVFGDNIDVVDTVFEDVQALREAVVGSTEERARVELKEQLDKYAESVPPPTPLELALYANCMAEQRGLNLGDLQELADQERVANCQRELKAPFSLSPLPGEEWIPDGVANAEH
jgi:hypothetical protein